LADVPDAFAEIEQEIDWHFRQGAGQLTAALLAEVAVQPTMNEPFDQIRQQAMQPLQSPEPRRLRVRLLCGLMLFITTGHCAPRRKKQTDSQERQAGLYPELAALGFGKGCSPALQYTVARTRRGISTMRRFVVEASRVAAEPSKARSVGRSISA